SAKDFRKQVSKTLVDQLTTLGFKGSGFNYRMEGENFIFILGVQTSRWGGECCVELGIQPKDIDSFGNRAINFEKLKYYECEFRTRLASANGTTQWLEFTNDQEKN